MRNFRTSGRRLLTVSLWLTVNLAGSSLSFAEVTIVNLVSPLDGSHVTCTFFHDGTTNCPPTFGALINLGNGNVASVSGFAAAGLSIGLADSSTVFQNLASTDSIGIGGVPNTTALGITIGNAGTYQMNSGILNVASGGSLSIGTNAATNAVAGGTIGIFNQNGAGTQVNVSGTLVLGFSATGNGLYDLIAGGSGNALALTASNALIGNGGQGYFNQECCNVAFFGPVTLGGLVSGVGRYDIYNGTLFVGSVLNVGDQGQGTFNQFAGTQVTLQDGLRLGNSQGSLGNYNMNGGTLQVGNLNEAIGNAGEGHFTQIGGTNVTTGGLLIGVQASGNGTYNLSAGGTLTVQNSTEVIGVAGVGHFIQDGSAHTTNSTQTLILGQQADSIGTYTLQAGLSGSVTTVNETIGASGTGMFTQGGGTNMVSGNLILGGQSTGNGTYTLSGQILPEGVTGNLSVGGNEFIGSAGTGTFAQSGGTHTVSGILGLGSQSTGTGSYDLSGGSLTVTTENIGFAGVGTFTQEGGTHTVTGSLTIGNAGQGSYTQSGGTNEVGAFLILGSQSSSHGTYELQGGSLSAQREVVGVLGTGEFTQTGGQNTVTNGGALVIGAQAGSTGTYTLNDGSLSANTILLGGNVVGVPSGGVGTFNQNGGQVGSEQNPIGTLTVGGIAGGQGNYNMTDGSLTVGSATIGNQAGSMGTFTQTGGTHTVTGLLTVGSDGQGTYNLSGGRLSTGATTVGGEITSTGTFIQTGGAHSVTGTLLVGDAGYGSYRLSDPNNTGTVTLTVGSETIGNIATFGGTFTQTGGTHTSFGDVAVGGGGQGTYTMSGPSFLVVNGNLTLGRDIGSNGTFTLNAGSITATNEIVGGAGTGTFNQNNGSNIVTDTLTIAQSPGSVGIYNLSGGTLTAGSIQNNGILNYSGGTLNATVINNGQFNAFRSLGQVSIPLPAFPNPSELFDIANQTNLTGCFGHPCSNLNQFAQTYSNSDLVGAIVQNDLALQQFQNNLNLKSNAAINSLGLQLLGLGAAGPAVLFGLAEGSAPLAALAIVDAGSQAQSTFGTRISPSQTTITGALDLTIEIARGIIHGTQLNLIAIANSFLGFVVSQTGEAMGELGADPPDPNYKLVILPQTIQFQSTTIPGVSPTLNSLINTFTLSDLRLLSDMSLLSTSVNRYGSALAAGDVASTMLQLLAIGQYASMYQADLGDFAAILGNIRAEEIAEGFPNTVFDPSVMASLQQILRSRGLSLDVVNLLLSLGYTIDEITALYNGALGIDPNSIPSFPLFTQLADVSSDLATASGGPVTTPEPSTWLLFGSGLAGLAAWRRKKAA